MGRKKGRRISREDVKILVGMFLLVAILVVGFIVLADAKNKFAILNSEVKAMNDFCVNQTGTELLLYRAEANWKENKDLYFVCVNGLEFKTTGKAVMCSDSEEMIGFQNKEWYMERPCSLKKVVSIKDGG